MELISKGNEHPSKSRITMLPFIDLSPSDESFIYSTLLHIIDQARQKKVFTPSVTFDQPLWIKLVEIVRANRLKILTRLSSFIGSLGITVEGSGLEKALETVNAPNTVTHIFSGKDISRALKSHFLVDAALTIKLISSFFPKSRHFMLTDEEGEDLASDNSVLENQMLNADEIDELQQLYSVIDSEDFDLESIKKSKVLNKLKSSWSSRKNMLLISQEQQSFGCNTYNILISQKVLLEQKDKESG